MNGRLTHKTFDRVIGKQMGKPQADSLTLEVSPYLILQGFSVVEWFGNKYNIPIERTTMDRHLLGDNPTFSEQWRMYAIKNGKETLIYSSDGTPNRYDRKYDRRRKRRLFVWQLAGLFHLNDYEYE